MDVNLEIQTWTPNNLGVTTASLLFMPQDGFLSSSGFTEYDQIEPDIDMRAHVLHIRKEWTLKVEMMSAALEGLCKAHISVMDLLLAILSGEFSEFYSHWLAFLCDSE